jgi:gluconate kinase
MKAEMLRSQFEALEEPEEAWVVDVSRTAETIVEEIVGKIS